MRSDRWRRDRLEPAALVAGLGVILIGVLALLDSRGSLHLSFGVLGPVVCAVAGATLLVAGLTRSD